MSNEAQPPHVSSACYPIAQPLATILQAAIIENEGENREPSFQMYLESTADALKHLIRNCFVAMDDMYFATPPSQRNEKSFQHRLAIRISTDEFKRTLTITDYGSGMTRSDIINSLVGSRLSPRAIYAGKALHELQSTVSDGKGEDDGRSGGGNSCIRQGANGEKLAHEHSTDDDSSSGRYSENDDSKHSVTATDETDSGSTDHGDDSCEDTEDESAPTSIHKKENGTKKLWDEKHDHVPCLADDIGGLYAALCALGEEIEICTKSKFDDYYVFKLPADNRETETHSEIKEDIKNTPTHKNKFSKFSVTRPMDEGVKPTTANGFGSFTDVRGDSGTRITIVLNQSAIDAGFLKEDEVLKPLLGQFLQASPYSVILDNCCTDNERADIIDASQREMDHLVASAKQNERNGAHDDVELLDGNDVGGAAEDGQFYNTVKERSKFIPLRLSMGERKMLRLVEATMSCSEYTTEVDKPFKSSTRRTHGQMKHISSVLRGMVTSCDYAAGQTLLEDDNYSDYEQFFRQMFEIARRHKIMNPEKMRTEYGKLIYLLQDAVSPSIQPHLTFSCKGKIETVYKFLEERDGLKLLDDPLIEIATREVLAGRKTRSQISHEIRRKEVAVSHLKREYRRQGLTSDDIHLCLYSICDNDSFLNSNRVPIDKMIGYLEHFFSPTDIQDEGYSLSIVSGQDGSRLSHSHERQYYFALQSLTLWRDIIDDMFRLWAMAEEDLLSESVSYALQDTGQGFQRVQQSPLTYRSMQKILSRVQSKVKQWVGSNVIHLGDHNVPNALTFIDKYTQVPRILSPIVTCLENVERICEEDDGIRAFIETGYGGVEQVKKDILYDFFKSAFDGSGADNFYDAGSCIDGRLTSAWNWCSQLQDKPFYCIFKLTGFTGFDGEFK